MSTKKIAMINDISGFGHCSMAVSLPVISALKVQCCPVPTSIFSNHTGFKDYYSFNFTPYMKDYIDTWKKLELNFDGIYAGYLSSEEQIDIVRYFIENFRQENTKIIIDPVMGDNGKLYQCFTESMCNKIKELIKYANILTPNVTECAILTDTPFRNDFTIDDIVIMIKQLSLLGIDNIVVTGFKPQNNCQNNNTITNVCYCDNKITLVDTQKRGTDRPGTGDIFASIISACSVNGTNLYESVRLASNFIGDCIEKSDELNIPISHGVCVEECLSYLCNQKYN